MSTANMIKVSAGCPTFDGTDYPYWKNKMCMHLEAIDNDLWYVVENGVPSVTPSVNAADVKRFKQLNSQAKNIICGHLSKGQYGRVSALEKAKLIWDRLSKVNEGVSTQCDSRVDVLRNLFNRFKRLDNENVQQTFDRLTDISNELQALGAADITDHEVVKKLLRSLDSSFDTLALMIQERGDYKALDPADILERLNTHEFQLAEKRDLYGSSYGRSRALKAKAVSESEGEDSDSSLGDPEEISEVLAMLVRNSRSSQDVVALENPQEVMMYDQIPHPVTTRRELATNARNMVTTFKIVLSGRRNQRRRNTRITVLMTQRRRRNLQSPHHQNPQSIHLTRRAA